MFSLPRRYFLLFLALAFALLLTEWLVVQSPSFAQWPGPISLGVTVDVVLGLPLLYYGLIVRRGIWSKISLIAVFGVVLGLAKWLLPIENQTYVNGLTRALPLLEAGVLGYVAYHGVSLIRTYRRHRQTNPDFIQNLRQSLVEVTGQVKLSRILVTEVAVVRYGLLGWLGGVEVGAGQRGFTSHWQSGQVALLVAVVLIAGIETVAVHFLVARWSLVGAWLLTATSLYSLLFIIAETVTTVKRPTYLDGPSLHLRFGLRCQGSIALSNIERVEPIHENPKKAPHTLNGPILVQPNVLLTLREPVLIEGIYGLKKTVTRVALLVDERDAFLKTVSPTAP